jgi:hypothetical protein
MVGGAMMVPSVRGEQRPFQLLKQESSHHKSNHLTYPRVRPQQVHYLRPRLYHCGLAEALRGLDFAPTRCSFTLLPLLVFNS